MVVSYLSDDSPATSRSITPQSHLRRRSSVTHSNAPSSLGSPLMSRVASYNEKTGVIALPPSPPLHAWDERKAGKSALGLYDGGVGKGAPLAWRAAPKGRAYTLPRPWYTALALTGVTMSFVFLLSYLVPPSSSYQPTTILSRVRNPSKALCDPYSSAGKLQIDEDDADRTQWSPFDPTCQPPNFLAKLRDFTVHHHHAHADHVRAADFAWLSNKTALLIGDSVSREHVDYFCQLLGEESEVLRPGHHWAPAAPVRAPMKAQHSIERPKRLNQRGFRVVRDASRPRICYIPKLDFLLVSVFHFGLDQEDYWRDSRMPQYAAPGLFEHRLMDQVQPLINNIRADGRRTAPDYVEINSGMWDLARWAEQDVAAERDTTEALSQDRITWYRFRVGQMMDKVRNAFPNAKARVWRTLHYPTDPVAEHDYFMDKINPRTANDSALAVSYFSPNRIRQLDEAVRTLVLPSSAASPASSSPVVGSAEDDAAAEVPHPEFRLNEFGTLLQGHEAHAKDRLHGVPTYAHVLWSDIMLYELWRAERAGGHGFRSG
ncbi:hypothetical protein Rhopal_003913-T1 [Rhodotorula paludigena]|uniref:Proteophosphoglycan 5 n=1 Tax=Rhodotorula paludigena TaxID=86838 RepID=A0AAV5GLW1_9BASI|nr:hypothetical protein Rhopal_003913-T1 [Rhodotorula paludigena]